MLAEERPVIANTELDRPIWAALSARQADLGISYGSARRFRPDIAPFAATDPCASDNTLDLKNLLVGSQRGVMFMQANPVANYPGVRQQSADAGVQLVPTKQIDLTEGLRVVRLIPTDLPDILDLIDQTEPGPFETCTLLMGSYFGIKVQDRLVALAGERLKLPTFEEISAVCVHPDFRGRGFVRSLVSHVARTILTRGKTPILHTYAANRPAISLYERMGFEVRTSMHIARLAPIS